jgi:hypothetical protein
MCLCLVEVHSGRIFVHFIKLHCMWFSQEQICVQK